MRLVFTPNGWSDYTYWLAADTLKRINRLIDVQSDHWVGRAPTGVLEDFQALRIIYTAVCDDPTHPQVLDIGGTTMSASWVSLRHWRSLQWTSGARSLLDRHLTSVSMH